MVDLIAVLCPFGPLKILIESSRNENREIPGLLYSVTMVYPTKNGDDGVLGGVIPEGSPGAFAMTNLSPNKELPVESSSRAKIRAETAGSEAAQSVHSEAALIQGPDGASVAGGVRGGAVGATDRN